MKIWVFWVALVLLVLGLGLAAYFGIEYFDKKKKTTTNEIIFALGVVLVIVGIVLVILYFVQKSKASKSMSIQEMEAMPAPRMMRTANYGEMDQGMNAPWLAGMGSPYMAQGMNPQYANMALNSPYGNSMGFNQGFNPLNNAGQYSL